MTIRKVGGYGAGLGANTFTGAQRATHISINGALAGGARFSVNDYAYIGSPDAQDPTYLSSINIDAITKANPGVVTTAAAHGHATGDRVTITMPSGMTELHNVTATIIVLTATTFSIGINTTAYTTYTNYATNHGRVAPTGTDLAEVVGLTIRTDTVGGGGMVIRNRLYTGLMFVNFANDAGDIEGTLQINGTGNTSLSGARSFNIGTNYGPLGIWTSIQGTPVNAMVVLGSQGGASEGFIGMGGCVAPTEILTVAKNGTATIFIARANLDYGMKFTTTSASGNSTISSVGAGANLTLSAAGTLSLTAPAIGAATGTSLVLTAAATAFNATAIPAGGTAGSGFLFSSTPNYGFFFGSGAPTLVAAKGSYYARSDGSSTTTRGYIATDSAGTWTAITTVA